MLFSHKILMPAADSDNRCVDLRDRVEHCIVSSGASMEPATIVPTLLDHARIVELSGADAPAFAQAQFSSDVSTLAPGAWQWSAWLDAKGRVRYLFALLRPQADQFIAWLPRGNAAEMAAELARFVFRAKVAIRANADLCLFEAEAASMAPGALLAAYGGWTLELPGSPRRFALLATASPQQVADASRNAEWRLADIKAGLPWVAGQAVGEYTPQALGLDRLGAVSLAKGCYPGQEVVARLHYRGGNKRACFRIRVECADAPPPGTRIVAANGDDARGGVLHAACADRHHCLALAVLAIDSRPGERLQLETGEDVVVETPAR